MSRKKREDWETNRDISLRPRSGKFWCGGCDVNLVEDNGTCEYCGWHSPKICVTKKILVQKIKRMYEVCI